MTTYTYEQALELSIQYFNGDELAAKVFLDKYALRNNDQELLEATPEQMHRRMAKEFARIESSKFAEPLSEDEIFGLFDKFRYIIPQGSPMFGIGNDYQIVSLSNCYVVKSPVDSYGGIMNADQQLAQISKRRGGVGVDISNLRPSGAVVKNAARTSTGIESWMERYSNTIREVGQSGRRGALMITIDVSHPDIEKFITIKNDDTKVTGANISVRLSDEFLDAVKKGEQFRLRFPVNAPKGKEKMVKWVDAKELWKKIIHSAWLRAEPGLLFWDRVTKYNAVDCYKEFGFNTISTNPCVTGDTMINTSIGTLTIKEVIEKFNNNEDIKVLGYDLVNEALSYNKILFGDLTRKNAEIIKLTLSNSEEIKLTPDHRVWTKNRQWVEAKDLNNTDELIHVSNMNLSILNIENCENEDVYDIEVEKIHNFFANNLLVHNCGELPLCSDDSCRLMVLNLFSYVEDPFTEKAKFNFDLFKKHSKLIQRLMDDMIDLELEKLDQIINKIESDGEYDEIKKVELDLWKGIKVKCEQGRRTGTGVTAEGDMFAALGIPYASKKSDKLADQVHKTLMLGSYQSSMEMAREIGAFPIWNWNKEKDSLFLQTIKECDEELFNNIKKWGRRNIANLTIAPTGSVSILTQTTSGIEPLFMLDPYTRRKKINPNDKNVRTDFVDQNGDHWQEFKVYHPKVAMWMEITGEQDLQKSPWFGSTASDLNWTDRVKLQGTIQKYIDHSISVTVNLPNDVTEQEVAKIYEAAWEYGCKGTTIYRDGCRTGVLVKESETSQQESTLVKKDAAKRPQVLQGDAWLTNVKGEQYYVVVGLLGNEPYEIFTGQNTKEEGHHIIPKSGLTGTITKHARGKYSFDHEGISYNLTNGHNDENADALCRMISTSLRHGADISFVVHQLEKTKGDLFSFAKALARTLKKYIKDGTKVHGEECPACGSNSVERSDGCVICKNCGASKC